MKGCQLAVLTASRGAEDEQQNRGDLDQHHGVVGFGAFPARRAPGSSVSSIISRNAGTLKIAPVGLPSTKTGFESDCGKVEAEDVIQQIVEVRAEAHRDRHVRRRRIRGSDPSR